jgi:hypothetical protein
MPKKEATIINPIVKLKTIQQKVIWGGRSASRPFASNIVAIQDNEFVTITGSSLLLFENGSVLARKSRIIENKDNSISFIKLMAVTKDGKFLAISVKYHPSTYDDSHEINIHIYHTSNHFQDTVKPRVVRYLPAVGALRPGETLDCTCLAFSHDNVYLAVSTTIPSIGILIFEQFKGTVFQTIITDSIAVSVSFHPADANKILGTGEGNLVRFWKFTSKTIHINHVTGIKKGGGSAIGGGGGGPSNSTTFTAHGWVAPYAENTVVVGTNNGYVTTIQNYEQRVSSQQIFSSIANLYNGSSATIGVSSMLIRGDHVIVSSNKNLIVLMELRRIVIQKYQGLSCVLVPLKYYRMTDINRIYGLSFCFRDSVTAYSMIASCDDSVVLLDMITDHDLSGIGMKKSDESHLRNPSTDTELQDSFQELIDWYDCTSSKRLYHYHNGAIQSLSLANRCKMFITSSFQDCTVRCWNYDDPNTYNCSWLVENFQDRPEENPFHVDIHPLGLFIAFACENEVREYAVSDNSLDIIRRFIIRNAFQNTQGTPIIINQPVSMVKYSAGGHMIAVVTGKVAQIFHLYQQDENAANNHSSHNNNNNNNNSSTSHGERGGTANSTTSAGNNHGSSSSTANIEHPLRLMVLSDHMSPITDITFFENDKKIITTSSDGAVYSWQIGATTRSKEFICKGIAATKICVNSGQKCRTTLIATFENVSTETLAVSQEIIRRRRLSSFAVNKRISASRSFSEMSDPGSPAYRGSKGGSDLAALTSAFLKEFERSGTGTPEIGAFRASQSAGGGGGAGASKSFIAVWHDDISTTPLIIQTEVPVRSVALGRTGYPDPYELVALGMADGRIILSLLPIPYIEINQSPSVSITASFNSPVSVPVALLKMGGAGGGSRRKRPMLSSPSHDESLPGDGGVGGMGGGRAGGRTRRRSRDGIAIELSSPSNDDIMTSPHAGGGGGSGGNDWGNIISPTSRGFNRTATSHNHFPMSLNDPNNEGLDEFPVLQSAGGGGGGESPFPTNTGGSVTSVYALNENNCRILRIAVGSVTTVAFSPDGYNIIVGAEDGSVHCLTTQRSFTELILNDLENQSTSVISGGIASMTTANSSKNLSMTGGGIGGGSGHHHHHQQSEKPIQSFYMVERNKMSSLRSKVTDLEFSIESNKKEFELQSNKIIENKDKLYAELEIRLKKEIQKRDDNIINGRKEYLLMRKEMQDELEKLHHISQEALNKMELTYEKRLSQESLYLEKMKQAYDEYVIHAKMDMIELNQQTDQRIASIDTEKRKLMDDIEKQKGVVLKYYDYIKDRNSEVLQSLEEQQAEER